MAEVSASAQSTMDHIERLTSKINTLVEAREDSLQQLFIAMRREPLTLQDAEDLHCWAKDLNVSNVRLRLCKAMGVVPDQGGGVRRARSSHLWRAGEVWRGEWPVAPGLRDYPPGSCPVVYALFCGDEIAYIGQTTGFRHRMSQHRKEKSGFGITRWEAVALASADLLNRQERDAIFQHQPTFNKAGKRTR
jgi:hypothetical protein